MPDILIRGLDDETLRRLKVRAKRHGRSLQGEAKMLLEKAAGAGPEELAAMLDGWKERFAGRQLADSAALISEDRDR
jgi:plasmid stability protein